MSSNPGDTPEAPHMAELQERHHGAGHDYEPGSPHLRHPRLRNTIIAHLRQLVKERFDARGHCRVLEIGAGHGGFTDHLAATGADVTVTEMSRSSLDVLAERFSWNPRVRLIHDAGGTALSKTDTFDLVVCISVLHHISDYVGFVADVADHIGEGGSFASFQDPLWYPRQRRLARGLDRSAYYAWRVTQPGLAAGLATRVRRARGVYDETRPADMVEYHVVRDGVDEVSLANMLGERFQDVAEWRYWSTQHPILQAVGAKSGATNTFAIISRNRRQETSTSSHRD